jgi:hypothetical protein
MPQNPSPKGFNLIGYAISPMGLREDLRSFAAMLNEDGRALINQYFAQCDHSAAALRKVMALRASALRHTRY